VLHFQQFGVTGEQRSLGLFSVGSVGWACRFGSLMIA